MNNDDYKKTIADAADTDDTKTLRDKKRDAEFAYDALAGACAMGMIGFEDYQTNLLNLELAAELGYMHKLSVPKTSSEGKD